MKTISLSLAVLAAILAASNAAAGDPDLDAAMAHLAFGCELSKIQDTDIQVIGSIGRRPLPTSIEAVDGFGAVRISNPPHTYAECDGVLRRYGSGALTGDDRRYGQILIDRIKEAEGEVDACCKERKLNCTPLPRFYQLVFQRDPGIVFGMVNGGPASTPGGYCRYVAVSRIE